MKKIFVHCKIDPIQEEFLSKDFSVSIHNANESVLSPTELLEKANAYDGILCQGNLVNSSYIEANKGILKIISNVAVGYDNIDIDSANKNKVAVFNTPNILNNTVADFTLGLIISIARKICEGNNYVKAGKWKKNSWPLFLGDDLYSENLGIIGMGSIGKKVALMAKAFGMKIFYHNRNRLLKEEEKKYDARYLELEEILKTSKFLVLLLPLNTNTKHLINKNTFPLMRKDSYIINVARGQIIKEDDLVEALEKKIITGAGLDVFEFEPKINEKLLKLNNVVLMPHAGSASLNTRNKMVNLACQNIYNFFKYKKTENLVNKEVFK